MYEILINDKNLYYPGDKEFTAQQADLKLEVGNAGELDITIPTINPSINEVQERAIITIIKNDSEFWRGNVRKVNTNFQNSKKLYVVEDLSFLGEVQKYTHEIETTYESYFQSLIQEYNTKVNEEKKFEVGYILRTPQTTRHFTHETASFLDILRDLAGSDYYVRIRRQNGHRYVDIVNLENYGTLSPQQILFGENLIDFVKESTDSWLLTAILPLGEETETELVEGIPERVNISSVNQGSKVLVNQTAVNRYGYIEKIVQFSGVTDPASLKTQAQNYLARNAQPRLSMDITAVDLAEMSIDYGSYKLGDAIHVICEPFGIDQIVSLCNYDIDILNPGKNKLTLSSNVERRSFTAQQNEIESQLNELPSKSEVLIAARNNARSLLNNPEGGHIIAKFDETGSYIEEVLITNEATESASTQKWVINLRGIGFMHRESINDEWEEADVPIAMTMEGKIVADYITSGTLKLAGDGSDATLEIFNREGTIIGRWNENGIYAATGTFAGNLSAAGGTFKGNLSAAGGTFSGNLSAVGGTFSGNLSAAGGTFNGKLTASSGGGELSISGGDLYMNNNKTGGPGLYMRKGDELYACWGARNCAAQADGSYREVSAMDIMRAAENASDKRLKQDIEDLDDDIATKLIMSIKTKSFKFIKEPNELNFGVIAQDIRKIEKSIGIDTENNRLCYKNKATGKYSVDYTQLIAPMIKVIQNQQEQINKIMEGR